jgi:MFS family permease
MNNANNRWWIGGLLGLILGIALALALAPTPLAEGGAGLLGLIALAVCILALLLVVAALWPGFTQRAKDNLETSPGKSLMVGLVNYVFLGAIILVAANLGPVGAIGLLLVGVLLAGTFLGLPAAALLVGERLHQLRERETTRWDELLTGGAALYLAALMPLVGWFLLLPALCLWSFGAAALALASRRKPSPSVE